MDDLTSDGSVCFSSSSGSSHLSVDSSLSYERMGQSLSEASSLSRAGSVSASEAESLSESSSKPDLFTDDWIQERFSEDSEAEDMGAPEACDLEQEHYDQHVNNEPLFPGSTKTFQDAILLILEFTLRY